MQNLQDIHDKIFFETKTILETLCKINSKDELLAKQDLFTEVTDRIAFLRILEKNEEQFSRFVKGEDDDNFSIDNNQIIDEATEHVEFNINNSAPEIIEEEVVFTNELNDFEEEFQTEEMNIETSVDFELSEESTDEIPVRSAAEAEVRDIEIPLNSVEDEEFNYAARVAQKERDLEEMEERRRKIVEFSKPEILPQGIPLIGKEEIDSPQDAGEKKFKLANIKGIKVVQQLFDNDPLEDEKENEEVHTDSGSLLKSNIRTDFMEAEKKKTEFRLDLNDKVAFTKILFSGNEGELKTTIEKLNSFTNLDDAKQYLSEVYYRKDWSKADEYAQRLWNLVENKFM